MKVIILVKIGLKVWSFLFLKPKSNSIEFLR